MIRIGAVNIDTSHPMGFGEVLEQGCRGRYTGVYDDSFRPEDEVRGFMERFGVRERFRSLDALADSCDIGFIHSCNWDDHLRLAMPFIKKNKPVFLDKPLVGSLKDCREARRLVSEGAVILGSSSARYAYEVQEFLSIPAEERGEIIHVYGTAGVDEFNYGIHITELIGGLMGTGAESVRHMGTGRSGEKYAESFHIQFSDGKSASFTTFTGTWQPFAVTILTTKGTWQFQVDSSRLYEALIHEICCRMEGKPNRLAPVDAILESTKIMLAGAASRASAGVAVSLADLTEDGPGFDGLAFYNAYRASAGRMYTL